MAVVSENLRSYSTILGWHWQRMSGTLPGSTRCISHRPCQAGGDTRRAPSGPWTRPRGCRSGRGRPGRSPRAWRPSLLATHRAWRGGVSLEKICKFVSHQDSPEAIDKEFLRDVVPTVWVFKSQIKLIVWVQHLETLVCVAPGTFQTSAGPININTEGRLPAISRKSEHPSGFMGKLWLIETESNAFVFIRGL